MNRFGTFGGVNIASIDSLPDDGFSSKTGIVLGGYYEFVASPYFSLSPEFMVVSKGGKRASDSVQLNISYFEVPILMKLRLAVKKLAINIFTGPSIGFVTSSSGDTAAGDSVSLTHLYPNEMAVQVGAGAELPLTSMMGLIVNARYVLGLSDISEAANNYKTKGMYLLAGLSFRLGEGDQFTDTESRAKEYLEKRNGSKGSDEYSP